MRVLEDEPLSESFTRYTWGRFIERYLLARAWLRPESLTKGSHGEISFADEKVFWDAVHSGALWETRRIRLDGVMLMDWIPVQPGVYHHTFARQWRREALDEGVLERTQSGVVLSRQGKGSMVSAGVGCMRLAVKELFGAEFKLLSATSSGVAHRGLVIAVPKDDYASIAETIEERGACRCTVSGEFRFWKPSGDRSIGWWDSNDQVLVRVDSVLPDRRQSLPSEPRATPVVTFQSKANKYGESPSAVWCAYGNLNPAVAGDLDRCREWLERHYVSGYYDGQIVTDCDELRLRFESVVCPVRAVMNPNVPASALAASLSAHGLTDAASVVYKLYVGTMEIDNVTSLNITGDGNVVGDSNRVITTINKTLADNPERRAAAQELALLRAEIEELRVDDKYKRRADRAIADVEDELGEQKPDEASILSALSRVNDTMAEAGEAYDNTAGWARRFADTIGTISQLAPGAMSMLPL